MSLRNGRVLRPVDGGTGQDPQTASGLLALAPPGRLNSINPIIPHFGDPTTGWAGGQTMECCVLVDPHDSSRLLMYFCGQGLDGLNGYIGRATAAVTDPTHWTFDPRNPLFGGSNRLDSIVYDPVADLFMAYSTLSTNNAEINLYTSPGTDGINFTAYPSNPVFQSSQCLEAGTTNVTQGAVIRIDATHWYMIYAHSGSYGTLPDLRLASSSDGKAWTDTGTTSWAQGAAGAYDSTHLEWHQIQQTPDGTFLLVAECYDGTTWTIGAATSPTITGAFTKQASPIFKPSGVDGTFDKIHVATPAIFQLNGEWYLFYCGSHLQPGPSYNNSYWSVGMAKF